MSYTVCAQIKPINTDRPDETEGTAVIDKGYYQIESGTIYERSGNYTYNSSILFRAGIGSNLELRLQGGFINTIESDKRKWYLDAPMIGIKAESEEEEKYMPAMSFLFSLYFPVLSPVNTGENVSADLRLLLSKSISDKFSLSSNLAVYSSDADDITLTLMYTLSAGYDISKKLSMFGEIYGYTNENAPITVDGGFSYRIKNNIAIDLAAGKVLKRNTYFINAGISLRLPE